jgi:hypothetical protein
MRQTIIKCDHCGREKKEANHWFAADVYDQAFIIRGLNGPFFQIVDVNSFSQKAQKVMDLCGETCVMQSVQQWLAKKDPCPTESSAKPS